MPEATESLLTGARALRQHFMAAPYRVAERDQPLLRADAGAAQLFLIHRGIAYRSCSVPSGKRAILDLLLPGDISGIDQLVLRRPDQEIIAAGTVGYRALPAAAVHRLVSDPEVALSLIGLLAEVRARMDRHLAAIARLQARERLCTMLLDVHDRLRRRDLIVRPSFNLHLTQEQIADYLGLTMVHVNRTLRQLREERLALIDRQVVIIIDLPRLREIVYGIEPAAGGPRHFSLSPEPAVVEQPIDGPPVSPPRSPPP
ncbi:MAG: Crp/Fnr family transcriptional regulator, partial [Thiohalocapsa sp.]